MNYKLLLLLCLIISVTYSCGKPTDRYKSQTYTYIYENKSGYDIHLSYYTMSKKTEVSIKNEQNYSEEVIFRPPYSGFDPCIFFSDSVKVVYADGKTIVYNKSTADKRTIYSRYEHISSQGRNHTYKFTFTPEDYSKAQ